MRTITLLLLALVLVAGATTVTFQPDPTLGKDALVSLNYPDHNYGDNVGLLWGYGSGQWETYIEFLGLNDTQYQGATVTSAILSLYVYSMSGGTSDSFWVTPCATSWNENTITWNDRPSGTGGSWLFTYPADAGWINIDITTIVREWLDGTRSNYGMYFINHHYSHDNDYLNTRSSDYADDSTLRPKLVMEYYGAAVEEATWGQLKAGI